MAKIIAITNQKGGVGKTTTSVNLAASLAAAGKRVLMVDLDPQGNATMGCGVDKQRCEHTVYDALVGQIAVQQVIVPSGTEKFDVLPANADLTAAEVQLLKFNDKETRLRQVLQWMDQQYDYILVDCPPSLNMLTVNALTAAEGVIIPLQCEYYALEGLSSLLDTISQVNQHINPYLTIEGILRTMYDPRNSLTSDVSEQLSNHFGDKLYRTVIPRNVRLAEAPSYGLPAIDYDRQSRGALAYIAMAGEMLRREEQSASENTVTEQHTLSSS